MISIKGAAFPTFESLIWWSEIPQNTNIRKYKHAGALAPAQPGYIRESWLRLYKRVKRG